MIIEYDPINGEAIPDGLIEQTWENIKVLQKFCTSSELLFDRARIALCEGEIQDLQLQYKGEVYDCPLPAAWPVPHPEDYLDVHIDILQRLIEAQYG
jgi:hypothetical protein